MSRNETNNPNQIDNDEVKTRVEVRKTYGEEKVDREPQPKVKDTIRVINEGFFNFNLQKNFSLDCNSVRANTTKKPKKDVFAEEGIEKDMRRLFAPEVKARTKNVDTEPKEKAPLFAKRDVSVEKMVSDCNYRCKAEEQEEQVMPHRSLKKEAPRAINHIDLLKNVIEHQGKGIHTSKELSKRSDNAKDSGVSK